MRLVVTQRALIWVNRNQSSRIRFEQVGTATWNWIIDYFYFNY